MAVLGHYMNGDKAAVCNSGGFRVLGFGFRVCRVWGFGLPQET